MIARTLLVTALVSIVARPVAAAERSALAAAGRAITVEADGTISASIANTPLAEVVAQLAQRTGATVFWIVPPGEEHARLSFHHLEPSDAIARVLAHHNYTLTSARNAVGQLRPEIRIGSVIDDREAPARVDVATSLGMGVPPKLASAAPLARSALRVDGSQPAAAADRERLATVRKLVDDASNPDQGSPVSAALERAYAQADAGEVERATMVGLASLPDDALESAARSDESLRSMAIDLLGRRAESDSSTDDAVDAVPAAADDAS